MYQYVEKQENSNFNSFIIISEEVLELKSTQIEIKDDEELKKDLEASKILKLYPKFLRAGVNSTVLWDLDEEMLASFDLDKFEMLLYKRAKEKLIDLGVL